MFDYTGAGCPRLLFVACAAYAWCFSFAQVKLSCSLVLNESTKNAVLLFLSNPTLSVLIALNASAGGNSLNCWSFYT